VLHRPRFKPHFRVEALDGEGVLVLSEAGQTLLRGRLHELVTPLIDGRASDELVSHLSGQIDPASVYYTLAELGSATARRRCGRSTISTRTRRRDDSPRRACR
jgi:ribosomal protein S12 methylthiotransferase accessory factor